VKRTRGIWFFASNPVEWPAVDAATEADFYAAQRAVFRRHDPHRPDQWMPQGGATNANEP
jgi:hypothetical protein